MSRLRPEINSSIGDLEVVRNDQDNGCGGVSPKGAAGDTVKLCLNAQELPPVWEAVPLSVV